MPRFLIIKPRGPYRRSSFSKRETLCSKDNTALKSSEQELTAFMEKRTHSNACEVPALDFARLPFYRETVFQ
jgi:hypothetical protein